MEAFTPITLWILFLLLKTTSTNCKPEAEYQIFSGFHMDDWTLSEGQKTFTTSPTASATTSPTSHKIVEIKQTTSTKHPPHFHHHLSDHHRKHHQSDASKEKKGKEIPSSEAVSPETTVIPETTVTPETTVNLKTTVNPEAKKTDKHTTEFYFMTPFDWQAEGETLGELPEVQNETEVAKKEKQELSQTLPPMRGRLDCPEEEKPWNIGPYEVPTQRDLVLLTVSTLHRVFRSYHQKAMLFLDDIQKVVRATDQVAKKCRGDKEMYRKCVRVVSNRCKMITKSLTTTLEQQRQDILQFGQKKICSIEAMKEDPVKLLKILASEEASLEFALPGFLRLLNVCNAHCMSPTSTSKFKLKKPTRHLTDTDIVIRHFLTEKKYKRLLKPPSKPISEKPKPAHKSRSNKKILMPSAKIALSAKMKKPLSP